MALSYYVHRKSDSDSFDIQRNTLCMVKLISLARTLSSRPKELSGTGQMLILFVVVWRSNVDKLKFDMCVFIKMACMSLVPFDRGCRRIREMKSSPNLRE